MSDSFVHLRVHSEYSIVDGIVRINDLVKQVAGLQMSAIGISDYSNLFAMVKFYRKAMAAKVKPIIGADIVLHENGNDFSFTLICQNKQGYQNLTCLISEAYVKGQGNDGVPRIKREWLAKYQHGLLMLSGARRGDVGQALLANNAELAEERLCYWQKLFGDRFYIELQRTGRARESDYIHAIMPLAAKLNIPVVATNAVCFLQRDDFEAHEARVCIHDSYVLDDKNRPRNYSEQQYLKSAQEMQELFSDIPEAITNTAMIAKRCNLKLSLGNVHLPQFPVPAGLTIEQYFEQVSKQGLEDYLQDKTFTPDQLKEYQDRLQIELDVINQMGFPGYFLIVADFIGWAKRQKIPVGPGRGSGAGSLVAFVLKITALDPIEHELLFERFLNPERVSMPDFDIDFCMERRDEVIGYVAERYGREAVSQIITYGTMAAKAVVRDVGRVLGYPYGFCDKIAKLIPFELGITLEKALVQEAQLHERYRHEEEVTMLIDLAKKLEGVTRNAGKHAGGVVIAPGKLTDFTPLYCEPGGENLVTQFDKDDVEAVGLVKFDFLGLRTLTIIDWAVQNVNRRLAKEGKDPIDIETIPLDDKASFDLLKSHATTAVFQLESRGMKDLIRRLQPDSFEEITALVALFRPGPLQSGMVDDFIDRKHGRAPIDYPHPDVETILKPTYGVILYQEQVMQIAQVLAGYSLGGADILRRAMGKKKPEEMAKQRQVFLTGSAKRGIDKNVAEHIFDLMEKFAGYGFNKSHSAAYALIAYQTAWLKAHYPAEFMAAVLSSDMDNTDKVVGFLQECQRMELQVMPPNINRGVYQFSVNEQGVIEYGLGAIKGVGEAAIEHIVAEREANGCYRDLFDFCQRLDLHKVSRRVLEPLVRSGAFDSFQHERGSMFLSIDKAIKLAEQKQRDAQAGQNDLFGAMEDVSRPIQEAVAYVDCEPWSERRCLTGEKETLGLYVTGHPLNQYKQELAKIVGCPLMNLARQTAKEITIAGMIQSVRVITTKNGRRFAVIALEDHTATVEVTLFSKVYEVWRERLLVGEIVVVRGNIEEDRFTGGVRIVAEVLITLNDYRNEKIKRLRIFINEQKTMQEILDDLPHVIANYKGGRCPITIDYTSHTGQAELALGRDWWVKPDSELLEHLTKLCGNDKVLVEY